MTACLGLLPVACRKMLPKPAMAEMSGTVQSVPLEPQNSAYNSLNWIKVHQLKECT